jgi:NADH dehydrogenase
MAGPRIVIIGGGAAGLELATILGNKLGKENLAEIHLVDQNLTNLWKPLWHEAAAGTLSMAENEINYINQSYKHNFSFHLGSLTAIERKHKFIKISNAKSNLTGEEILPARQLNYDYLVIAVGSVHNNFNTPGVEDYCYFLDSLAECKLFQQQIISKFLKIQERIASPTNIVIIGGGATGVELASELHYAFKQNLSYSKEKAENGKLFNLSLIESGPRILSAMPDNISNKIVGQLTTLGIKIYPNEKAVNITKNQVTTSSGLNLPADLIVWAAGIKAPDFLATLGLTTDKNNKLLVKPTLQIISDENIFALGDCANCQIASDEAGLVPATAQAARQQAIWLATALTDLIKKHKPLGSFKFKDYGSIVTVRHNNAFGYIKGDSRLSNITLRGKFALLVYRCLYRRHQAILHGWWSTILLVISDTLLRTVRPRLKLH